MTISSGNVLFIGRLLKRHFSRVVTMRSRMEGIYKRMEEEEEEMKAWKILELCYKRGNRKMLQQQEGNMELQKEIFWGPLIFLIFL